MSFSNLVNSPWCSHTCTHTHTHTHTHDSTHSILIKQSAVVESNTNRTLSTRLYTDVLVEEQRHSGLSTHGMVHMGLLQWTHTPCPDRPSAVNTHTVSRQAFCSGHTHTVSRQAFHRCPCLSPQRASANSSFPTFPSCKRESAQTTDS